MFVRSPVPTLSSLYQSNLYPLCQKISRVSLKVFPTCKIPTRLLAQAMVLSSWLLAVLSPSRVQLFVTPWTSARQASLSITNFWSLHRLMSIELVMPLNHLILSHLQSFAASGSFQMSQFFVSGGQSIGVSASASILPMNIQN